ncbi:MAG: 50S ribosomal protein L5 [Bradymonadales bacterium]|nr:MAG: 50S ribosomal protein L5 [Bradymonadales bacterium]
MAKREKTTKKPKKGAVELQAGEQIKGPEPRLRILYREKVLPELMKEFGFKNPMRVPKLKKIVINIGLGRATQNAKIIDQALKDLASITGQKPVKARSKQAISNFKLRAGLPIGVYVNLRGIHMWEFLDRLLNLALPRIRDFRGVHDGGFDGRGNFTLGLRDHLVFPEVDFDSADNQYGMNISFVTTAEKDEECRLLLASLGMPFRKRAAQKAA